MTPDREQWILPTLLIVGIMLVLGGGTHLLFSLTTPQTSATTSDPITRFVFANSLDLPLLVSEGGTLFYPNENDEWERVLDDDVTLHSIYADEETGHLFLATSVGLARLADGEWQVLQNPPPHKLVRLSEDMVMTESHGGMHNLAIEELALPALPDKIIALGSSHVLQAGEQIYISVDVDQWEPLGPSLTVNDIWRDENGALLVDTPDGVLRWGKEDNKWHNAYPHINDEASFFEDFQVFNGSAFATVNGGLLRYDDNAWVDVDLDRTAYLSQLEVGQGERLWVLDTGGDRLWSSDDGTTWSGMVITIADNGLPNVNKG